MTPLHRKMHAVNLHASQGPHCCVDESSLNLLPTDVWLSNSLCTHVTLYALSLCPFEQHCCFLTYDQMCVQTETLLGSSRRYVPEGLPRGMGAGRRLHSQQREQEQPQVMLGSQNYSIGKPTNIYRRRVEYHSLASFLKRLSLPYPDEEILSGYEEDFSSIRDGFSAWVKTDTETILKRHVVNAKGANPAFREGTREETLSIPRRIPLRHWCAQSLDSAQKAQHLQLEPVTSTRKRRSCRETHCGEVAPSPCRKPLNILTTSS